MKTTSFEISKMLAEIGFHEENQRGYNKKGSLITEREHCPGGYIYPSYDLETILEALPMGLDMFDGRFDLIIDQRSFFAYANFDKGTEINQIIKAQDESLADTAARLLILLHEKGLINFNKTGQSDDK